MSDPRQETPTDVYARMSAFDEWLHTEESGAIFGGNSELEEKEARTIHRRGWDAARAQALEEGKAERDGLRGLLKEFVVDWVAYFDNEYGDCMFGCDGRLLLEGHQPGCLFTRAEAFLAAEEKKGKAT